MSFPSKLTIAGGDYVYVDSKQSDKGKEITEKKIGLSQSTNTLLSVARRVFASSKMHSTDQPYRIDLAVRVTGSGTANTFYAPVLNLQPNSSSVTEATNFAALFDLARCRAITFKVRAAGSVAITNMSSWAAVYDPGNSGAYTSVVGTLVAAKKHRLGPIAFNEAASNVSVSVVNSTGYKTFAIDTTPIVATAGAAAVSEGVSGSWFACSDTSASVGYLKYAIDGETTNAVSHDTFIIYHMEYAFRT